MALKALDIFKLLPKTNCKKCGCPTCLAFAMKLAQKQASLDQCPDVTAASKAQLEGAAAPPIRLVTLGAGDKKVEIGNETVQFRHEESFYHPPAIGVIIPDNLDDAALKARLSACAKLHFTRVGARIGIGMVAVENVSCDAARFAATVSALAAASPGIPVVLMSKNAAHAGAAIPACGSAKPLIHAGEEADMDAFIKLAKDNNCPLALRGRDIDDLADRVDKAKKAGIQDLILDVTSGSASATVQSLSAVRRLALKRSAKGLGYPCMTVSRNADAAVGVSECCVFVSKYAGIVLTPLHQPEEILPILTVGQNLYTDPRKPIQVEPKLYTVGNVTNASPLLLTTNFSLTFYTVEGEVEASRVPAYIGVIDTEGTSVLTAFASDKMTSEKIAAFLKSDAVTKAVSHRKVIIPGYVAAMSGSLEEDSGWEVMVGPREASGIPKFLKTVWKSE
ncbi:MAG: acetyl-CoA decarbonylase/synthase complex subunit gamma [Verrucomicrobia bacterium]|nr:acetyl-CoA decarbonylase/synthase complex subunit gamma [Verrucomicrobiota bacterium]